MKDSVDRLIEEAQLDMERSRVVKQIESDLDNFIKVYYPPFKARGFTVPEALIAFKLHEIEITLNEELPEEDEEDE